MKIETLEDCLSILFRDQRVRDLANKLEVGGSKKVLQILALERTQTFSPSDEFMERLIEVMSDEEEVLDDIEVECLSSYSATTTITLTEFAGIYAIRNFEFGDLIYFSTAESAKQAVLKEFGVDWDHPEEFSSVVPADSLRPGES